LFLDKFIGNLWSLNNKSMIHYDMPKDVRKYVLLSQLELKIKTGNGKLSQQQTITKIIREHKELTESKKP
jgi:hypothetical protein